MVLYALFLPLAEAHGFPRAEFFGGYSYFYVTPAFRFDPLPVPGSGLHGWSAGGSIFFTRRAGIEFDAMGHAGDIPVVDLRSRLPALVGRSGFDHLLLLCGPRYAVIESKRMRASVHALLGASKGNLDQPEPLLEGDLVQTNFAGAFGGSLDFKLNERRAISIIRPNLFILRRPFLGTYKTFQFSTGVVFFLGRKFP